MTQPLKEAVIEHRTNFQEAEEDDDVDEEAGKEREKEEEEQAVAIAGDARWDCGSLLYDASELVAFTKLLPIIDHAHLNISNIDQIAATSSSLYKNNRRSRPPSATLSSPSILKKFSSSLQQGPARIRDRSLLENCTNPHDPDHQKIHGSDASIRAHDQQPIKDDNGRWSFAKWIRLMKRTLRTGHNPSKRQRCPYEEAIEKIVKHNTPHIDYKHHTVHHHHYHHHHYHHHPLYNSGDHNLSLSHQDCDQLDDCGLLFNHKDHDESVAHKVDKGCSHDCNITRVESARLSFETISKLCIDQNWM